MPFNYKLRDATLQDLNCEKDLGVQIDNSLTFSKHINEKVNKANSMMGVVRRAFRHLNIKTFNTLYKGIVRPHLEYAVPIWNPHLKKDIIKIEKVQRRATKQIPELKNMSYKERLTTLKLPTLVYRRMRGDMIEVFKILTSKYDPVVSSDLLPLHSDAVNRNRTRGHPLKLKNRTFRIDICKYSFSRRVSDMWNNLPRVVVTAPSINVFENRLDRYWSKLDIKFDFDIAMSKMNPFTATGGLSIDLHKVS